MLRINESPLWALLAVAAVSITLSAIAMAAKPAPKIPTPFSQEFAHAHRALHAQPIAEQPPTF